MSVIRKIFSGIKDSEIHSDFVKYSKGVFENKYLVEAKKQKDKWSIKTGAEFVNFIVRECLNEVNGEVEIKGIIVSTFDIREGMGGYVFNPEEKVKQFIGIKQLIVDTKTSPKKVIEVMERYPRAFFALSFSTPQSELKIKAKAPKSAKPSSGGEKEPAAEFLSLKTTNKNIAEDLLFGIGEFREVSIKHTLNITDIEIPREEKDPVKMRENAIRKGTIKRIMKVDDKVSEKEADFEA